MFKGLGNLASMMRQAQQIGGRMKAINEELLAKRVTATTGAGMIEVEANGLGEILRVKIEPNLVEQGDREMIEDLIPAAVNQAVAKARQLHMEAMKSMTGDLNIPGLENAITQFAEGDEDEE